MIPARVLPSDLSPIVGVTGSRTRASRVTGLPELLLETRMDLFLSAYPDAIARAGGVPVQITRSADPSALVRRLDALVIAGGEDIDPRLYGGVPGRRSTMIDPGRDRFELALIEAALHEGVPLLGICRGHQLINVAAGGTLHGDLPVGSGEAHGVLTYPIDARVHAVAFDQQSALFRVYGPNVLVNSFHHQSIDALGTGVVAVAHAKDGVIEAIEVQGAAAVGVQWHPEFLREPDPIFEWLLGVAHDRWTAGSMTKEHCDAATA